MNRILFEKDEIVDGIATFGGERAEHVMNVLHGEVGQVLKTGEIGLECGFSDGSYFIKTFREIKHCTPREYRTKFC